MYKILFVIIFSTLFLVACSEQDRNRDLKNWIQSKDKIKVLCTTAMITDLVKQIGGDFITTTTLIQGDLDPHSYQPVKGDEEKFLIADVIFYNGLDLEHGPSWQRYLSKKNKAVGLGNCIRNDFPEFIIYDEHGISDPHIWTDISLWAKTIPYIVEKLSKEDPKHRDQYILKGEKLNKELLNAHEKAVKEMQKVPENLRYLVTSHDAFYYFSRAYLSTQKERNFQIWQKRFAAPEGLAPDSQLSTTDIQEIIDYLKTNQICILFPESNVSQDSIKKIVDAGFKLGLKLQIADTHLYGDAMGPPGSEGDTYLKMIDHNIRTISKFLYQNECIQDPPAHCKL